MTLLIFLLTISVAVAKKTYSNEYSCYAKAYPGVFYKSDNLLKENSGYAEVQSIEECSGYCLDMIDKCKGATYLAKKNICVIHGSTIIDEETDKEKIQKKLGSTHISFICGELQLFERHEVMKYDNIKYNTNQVRLDGNVTSSTEDCLERCYIHIKKCTSISYQKSTSSCIFHRTKITLSNGKDYEHNQDWTYLFIDKESYVSSSIPYASSVKKPDSIEISWSNFVDEQRKFVDGYVMEYSNDGSTWTKYNNLIKHQSYHFYSEKIKDVKPGMSYLVRIRLSIKGKLAAPGPIIRTLTTCDEPTAPPKDIKVANVEGKAVVSWEPPPKETWQCQRVNYAIKYSLNDKSKSEVDVDPEKEGNSHKFTSSFGDKWEFQVLTRAVDNNGIRGEKSDWSEVVKFEMEPVSVPATLFGCDVHKIYNVLYDKDKIIFDENEAKTFEECVEKCLVCYIPCQSVSFNPSDRPSKSGTCYLHTSNITDIKDEKKYTNSIGYIYATIDCAKNIVPLPLPIECGKPDPEHLPHTTHRILRGREANPHSFPWQVSLMIGTARKARRCAGSVLFLKDDLVKSDIVVTTADCITYTDGSTLYTEDSSKIFVAAGDHDLTKYEPGEQHTVAIKAATDPLFRKQRPGEYDNDIGLILLKDPIIFTKTVRPICLPTDMFLLETKKDPLCIATGYGGNATNDIKSTNADTLQQTLAPINPPDICKNKYFDFYTPLLMICVGDADGKTGLAHIADRGAPLQCLIDDVWTLQGLLSYIISTDDNERPAVYTRVSFYSQAFIDNIQTVSKLF